jgi:hypothetical protein
MRTGRPPGHKPDDPIRLWVEAWLTEQGYSKTRIYQCLGMVTEACKAYHEVFVPKPPEPKQRPKKKKRTKRP